MSYVVLALQAGFLAIAFLVWATRPRDVGLSPYLGPKHRTQVERARMSSAVVCIILLVLVVGLSLVHFL